MTEQEWAVLVTMGQLEYIAAVLRERGDARTAGRAERLRSQLRRVFPELAEREADDRRRLRADVERRGR